MKKRRTIAVVVACAALVLGGMVVRGNWTNLFYDQVSLLDGEPPLGGSVRKKQQVLGFKKKYRWLPGDRFIVRSRICPHCRDNHIHMRYRDREPGTYFLGFFTDGAFVNIESLCICQQCFPDRKAR